MKAIFYLLSSRCEWRMSPRDFPSQSTVYDYFRDRREDRSWRRHRNALYRRARDVAGREAGPSADVIGGQSVKTTESGDIRGSLPVLANIFMDWLPTKRIACLPLPIRTSLGSGMSFRKRFNAF